MNWIKNLFNTDEIAQEIIEKSTSNQEAVSLLEKEVERLAKELDAKAFHVNELDKKILRTHKYLDSEREENKKLSSELKRVKGNYNEMKKNTSDRNAIRRQESMILKMGRQKYEREEYIKVIETLASKKSDKKELNENFTSNLQSFIDKTGLSLLELERVTDVNRTTVRELLTFKTNLTYDSLAGLSDVMCEYFGCMPVDLVKGRVEK